MPYIYNQLTNNILIKSVTRSVYKSYIVNSVCLCAISGPLGGFIGADPFGFNMFNDDPFSLAGPSLFATSAQPHVV